jgi:hypothetical protein
MRINIPTIDIEIEDMLNHLITIALNSCYSRPLQLEITSYKRVFFVGQTDGCIWLYIYKLPVNEEATSISHPVIRYSSN